MTQAVNHASLLPLYAAAGAAVLVLIADLAVGRRSAIFGTAAAGAVITLVCAVLGSSAPTFCLGADCSWTPAPSAVVVAVLFAALTLGVLALSTRTSAPQGPGFSARAEGTPAGSSTAPPGEYCFLLMSSMTGGVVIGYAGDLLTLIVGLETLTLPLYVLVGLGRTAKASASAVTFFLVSVISTAIALLGAALLFAATGALHLAALVPGAGPAAPLASVGVSLIVVGFAFKVAAVPLHAWAPATYDGAPIPIAAYLSTASKLGGVVALAAVVARLDTGPLLATLSVLTMTVGNLVALRQTRMIRLLAWSSVAQAGYILAPLAAGAAGVTAALAYAAFFVALEFVAFAVIVALLPPAADGGEISSYRGVAKRSPWPAAALVLALAGLAGLPPGLAGLFAKVTIVDALIDTGWSWLAGVVALNAVIALAYYIRTAAILYADAPGLAVADLRLPKLPISWPTATTLIAASAVAVALGFAPQLLFTALT